MFTPILEMTPMTTFMLAKELVKGLIASMQEITFGIRLLKSMDTQ